MEFRILGPLEVLRDGRPLVVHGAKERALLAVLLVHANEVVSTERLIDELWAEHVPRTARKSVQVRVAGLRRPLGRAGVVTHSGGYQLRVDRDRFDLYRFEDLVLEGRRALATEDFSTAAKTLREALSLWRGPPLVEFAHESFARPTIMRLEELRVAALELRIEADLALGLEAQLIAELEALVQVHPVRERLRGLLMLALYRNGRQAEALELYRRAREVLANELGIEPGTALRELHRAILRQDGSLAPPGMGAERSILVAADGGVVDELLAIAVALASHSGRELIVAHPVADASELAAAHKRGGALSADGVIVRAVAFTSESAGDDVLRFAQEQEVDLVLAAGASASEARLGHSALLGQAPCDVALYLRREAMRPTGPVLCLFGGGKHDWAALELAAWTARAEQRPLLLAGPGPSRHARDASRALASASLAVQRVLGISAEPVVVPRGEDAVLATANGASIVVVGLPERWPREGLGPIRTALAMQAAPPALLVRAGLRPSGLAPRESLTRFTWTLKVGP